MQQVMEYRKAMRDFIHNNINQMSFPQAKLSLSLLARGHGNLSFEGGFRTSRNDKLPWTDSILCNKNTPIFDAGASG